MVVRKCGNFNLILCMLYMQSDIKNRTWDARTTVLKSRYTLFTNVIQANTNFSNKEWWGGKKKKVSLCLQQIFILHTVAVTLLHDYFFLHFFFRWHSPKHSIVCYHFYCNYAGYIGVFCSFIFSTVNSRHMLSIIKILQSCKHLCYDKLNIQ